MVQLGRNSELSTGPFRIYCAFPYLILAGLYKAVKMCEIRRVSCNEIAAAMLGRCVGGHFLPIQMGSVLDSPITSKA